MYVATIEYRREEGGQIISVNRPLGQLMNFKTVKPQERITGLDEHGAAGTTALDATVHTEEVADEVSGA